MSSLAPYVSLTPKNYPQTNTPKKIKFIKVFAWEPHFLAKALALRAHEMDWLLKSRINTIFLYILWTSVPVLVSVVSFYVYVVWAGGEVSVSTAFTVRLPFDALFEMRLKGGDKGDCSVQHDTGAVEQDPGVDSADFASGSRSSSPSLLGAQANVK